MRLGMLPGLGCRLYLSHQSFLIAIALTEDQA